MRKVAIFLFYSFFLILLGRNLTFIPSLNFSRAEKPKDTEELREGLATFLKDKPGQFSIFYKDLQSGEGFGMDENTVLTAASLNKVVIIGYLYHLAAKKEINLEDKIVIQPEDIQDYGTGSLRYKKAGEPYTLKYLAQLAFKQSDNTAAHVLTIRLGEDNIQEYARQLGMNSTNMVDNETSASDIGRFFELLHQGKITSASLTREMMDFMKDTEFEDRIPRFLPKKVTVYHKIGDAVTLVHDGGIIDNGKEPFIMVVMSHDLKDEEKAKETIGQIAQFIYSSRFPDSK